MVTVLEQSADVERISPTSALREAAPKARRFTVDEYEKIIEAGVFGEGDRLELLRGVIVEMSPKGVLHAAINDEAGECFKKHLGRRVKVRLQNPIRLDDSSEPEPDLVLAKPQKNKYYDRHPTPSDIFLVMEIADTTVEKDRHTKALLYASAGIIQYVMLNVKARELEDYREPSAEGYRAKRTYRHDETFNLVCFPDMQIKVGELLPPG